MLSLELCLGYSSSVFSFRSAQWSRAEFRKEEEKKFRKSEKLLPFSDQEKDSLTVDKTLTKRA